MPKQSSAYGDTRDSVMLVSGDDLFQQWLDFESRAFQTLAADPRQRFGVALNVGAGRRLTESEEPFLRRFGEVHLFEPDAERRSALAAEVGADSRYRIHADPVENLHRAPTQPADFVLCKYVLQHMPTESLEVAAQQLRGSVAPGGTLGIFTSFSPDDDYYLIAYEDRWADEAVEMLGRRPEGHRITRAEFDRLASKPPAVPLLVTHHIPSRAWGSLFPDCDVQTQPGPGGVMFVAVRP